MKKMTITLSVFLLWGSMGCKPSTVDQEDFDNLKKEVINHFADHVAVATYEDLHTGANNLHNALLALEANPIEANLATARTAWKEMRSVWEQSESFLFGPVDANSYDPNTDTWPTDYVQMDSLLASTNPLSVSDIEGFTLSLRGYHPIEYILFGNHGDRTAASITARQKTYMINLSTDLKNSCSKLLNDWVTPPKYIDEVKNAGNGSTIYLKKQEIYLTIVEGLIGICEEVGEGKMKDPFDTQDPGIVESPYSGNSTTDFKNNIMGIQNVYLGKYKIDGKGLNDLVAAKNKSLDNKIQTQITAAINSFDNITMYYEDAIVPPGQRVQIQQTMDALATLKTTLDTELKPFIIQYITD